MSDLDPPQDTRFLMAPTAKSPRLRKQPQVDPEDRNNGSEAVCEVDCIHAEDVLLAREALPGDGHVDALAETFKTLGDPTRLRIVSALAGRELCVCDIAVVLGASQSAVSHSLRALRQLRLVRYRKAGKIAYYSLDDDHIAKLLNEGLRHVQEADETGA